MTEKEKKIKSLELDKEVVDELREVKKYMATKGMKVNESEIIMAALKIVKRTAGYWTFVCEMGGAKR
jgi:DNA-binding phage protein